MTQQRWSRLLMVVSALAISAHALAAAPPSSTFGLRVGDAGDEADARLLGVLTRTPLTLQFDEVPARDAFKAVADALSITIIGRWMDEKNSDGIDPDVAISTTAEARLAIDVIEEMLEQCEDFEDCTWQLRGGAIEIGTKRRLAVPAARQQRVYELTDLLLEPAYSVSPIGGSPFARIDTEYVEAVLGAPVRDQLRNGEPPRRKTKTEVQLELVEGIVETIEPGRWDFGTEEADADDTAVAPGSAAARDELRRRRTRLWATLRVFRDNLIITAPDFMHRQIGGYPQPITPLDTTVRLVPSPVTGQMPAAPAADDDGAGAGSAKPR